MCSDHARLLNARSRPPCLARADTPARAPRRCCCRVRGRFVAHPELDHTGGRRRVRSQRWYAFNDPLTGACSPHSGRGLARRTLPGRYVRDVTRTPGPWHPQAPPLDGSTYWAAAP
jgi:hypothetical protein